MANYERNTGHKHPLEAQHEQEASKNDAPKELNLEFPERKEL
mgnify:FL=1|jgi:hypothetical protein